jgi:hypothetical protein
VEIRGTGKKKAGLGRGGKKGEMAVKIGFWVGFEEDIKYDFL